MSTTIAVRLTGVGRGAVATVLLDGPKAIELTQRLFRNAAVAKSGLRENKTYFGKWVWEDYQEELVVCRTDKHRIEIHCHGGHLASQRILDSLTAKGVLEIPYATWLERSEKDRFTREALMLLPKVKTERLLRIVLDQTTGVMRTRLSEALSLLGEEKTRNAKHQIQELIDVGHIGVHIGRPFSVVLNGPPNAGKSSLINAVVGFERSIVYDQPGTTRDLVTVESALDGWPFVFTDTAGIRKSNDVIEQEGMRLAQQAIKDADLVLAVCDLTSPNPVAHLSAGASNVLVVGTKADLRRNVSPGTVDVRTSAKNGEGISELIDLIVKRLVPAAPLPGAAVPLSTQLMAELHDVLALLSDSSGAAAARQRLANLLAQ